MPNPPDPLRRAIDASLAAGRPLPDAERAALAERVVTGSGRVLGDGLVMHTEPHADDLLLGLLPVLRREPPGADDALVLVTSGHRGVLPDWPSADSREARMQIRYEETLAFAREVGLARVHALALPFYDRPDGQPDGTDRAAVASVLREVQPEVVTFAYDPPGGHATHIAVHRLLADALRDCVADGLPAPRLVAYRDVWCRFHLAEATHLLPLTADDLADVEQTFPRCYPSQAQQARQSDATGGRCFADVVADVWRTQMDELRTCLGADDATARVGDDAVGLLLLRELTLDGIA